MKSKLPYSAGKLSLILLSFALAGGALLSACSQNSDGSDASGSPSAGASASASASSEPPTPISIMTTFFGDEPPGPDNVVIKEIEKRTNTKLNITWVSSNSYNEKVNVTLASGDFPDLTLILDNFAQNVRTMAAQGAFWDLEPYIKDYPNLMEYPQEAWDNSRYQDGKIYSIPRVRGLDTGMVAVRKDWLDRLGMEPPQTTDELYEVMKAFTTGDPDGNGTADTVGLVGYISADGLNLGSFNSILNTFQGANGGWKIDGNGNLVNMTTDPSTKEALAWMRKAYEEGLIHKDFATLKNTQAREIVMAGKAGVNFEPVSGSWVMTEGVRKIDPQGDMLPLVSLTNPKGEQYVGKGIGYYGTFVIPKTVSEEKMKKILSFFDYGASPEGYELGAYGFADVHFTKDGDFYQQTEQAKKDIVSTSAFGQVFTRFNKYAYAVAPNVSTDYYERSKGIIDQISEISVSDPTNGLYSETWSKYRNEWLKKTTDLQVKIILGSVSLESWDDYAAKLAEDTNWIKSIQELNDAYKTKKGQ
ncbi:extracellular solute-binding protein [Cohnella fermenti]|uniref:Extracellular solute-binding protein n=1 Tax=Cohnella fermenti TaxID=2565925 RepID=A0A4S4C327_9BACL|nr:extracellular solute-binding protein [Cohnella fermenti]THF82128.1 extracellular solute-binding protein [Cohnella fermenti]